MLNNETLKRLQVPLQVFLHAVLSLIIAIDLLRFFHKNSVECCRSQMHADKHQCDLYPTYSVQKDS